MNSPCGSIKAVIFDIGATLITGPPVAPNKVIAKLIDNATPADVSSVIMTEDFACADDACCALSRRFGQLSPQTVTAIMELWLAQACAPVPIDGAIEAVARLKRAGLKIGLLSDIWSPYYTGVEAAIGEIVEMSDAIALSCRLGKRKPSPDNFQHILSDLNVNAAEAVMVGDTYTHDIEPALALGMSAVWVLARPDREIDSLLGILNGTAPVPTHTIASISELDLKHIIQ